jgi:hypothetical protein
MFLATVSHEKKTNRELTRAINTHLPSLRVWIKWSGAVTDFIRLIERATGKPFS